MLTEQFREECYNDTEKILRNLGVEDAKKYVELRKKINNIKEIL